MNKLRTFLSLLGVMVGIFVISAVFAVVDSMEENLMSSFEMLDDDVFFIQCAATRHLIATQTTIELHSANAREIIAIR